MYCITNPNKLKVTCISNIAEVIKYEAQEFSKQKWRNYHGKKAFRLIFIYKFAEMSIQWTYFDPIDSRAVIWSSRKELLQNQMIKLGKKK